MSDDSRPFGTMPQGRRLTDTSRPFGQVLMDATPEVVAWADRYFERLEEGDVDFTRSSHKVYAADGSGYFRLYVGASETAQSAGVSHYILRDGKLVLLRRPGSGRQTSELIGEGLVGRRLEGHEPLGTLGFR